MFDTLWIDLETYSALNLRTVGAHRYAEEAEIMLVQWALDDGPVTVWDLSEEREERLELLRSMIAVVDEVVSHGAFDPIMLATVDIEVPLEKRVDTMVLALEHGFPGALEKLCEIFPIAAEEAKMKEGDKLKVLFCSPCPKNWKLRRATKETHPDKWAQFLEYARLDIEAMRAIRRCIPTWNWTPLEREYWHLDQQTNARGLKVDSVHATAALDAFARLQKRLAAETAKLTNGAISSTTQREALLAHLKAHYGYTGGDMTADVVDRYLDRDDLHPTLRALLENRRQAAATSPAKYKALLKSACRNGRLHGVLQFCGAARTRRDSGRIFQPQNLPRPTMTADAIETGIRAMQLRAEELLFDVAELCISGVRGAIVAEEGSTLKVSDLSNIEGRTLAWLADEQWKLEAFRKFDRGEGPDLYKVTAGEIIGIPPEAVTKDQRQVSGKVPELACGYQGSVGAFRSMGGKVAERMTDDEILSIVYRWRDKHPKTKQFWYDMEAAARRAINDPKAAYTCGLITFDMKAGPDGVMYLRMRLPGGGYLSYRNPSAGSTNCETCDGAGTVRPSPEARWETCADCDGAGSYGVDGITYEGVDQYTRQWKRLSTYGGKLTENAVQAIARDIFFDGMRRAAKLGFPLVLRVHDELVAEVPDNDNDHTLAALEKAMATNPSWAAGLPLAASGFEAKRYRKD